MPAPPMMPQISKRKVIFDFSNMAYQALFAVTRTPEVLEKEFDGHYRIFISKVQALLSRMSDANCELIFCLDSFPQAKKDVYPEYKDGRKKFDFDPKKGLLSALSGIVDFKISKVKGYEADDVMASLVAQNPEEQCVVVSSDKDLWCLMQYNNCNIFDLHKNEYVTHEMFVEKFTIVNYKHLTLFKTLWGDSSDNIPNVMPRTQKSMIPLIQETDGTMSSFFHLFNERRATLPKPTVAHFDANIDQLIDNYTLVGLVTHLPVQTHPYVKGLEYHIGKE